MVRATLAHYRAVVVWLVGLFDAVWCCAVYCSPCFSPQGPAIYLISAHPEPTCAHSISGPRASTPVQSPVGPGPNRPHIEACVVRADDAFMTFLFVVTCRSASGTGYDRVRGANPPRPFLIPHTHIDYITVLSIPLAPFPISISAHQHGTPAQPSPAQSVLGS